MNESHETAASEAQGAKPSGEGKGLAHQIDTPFLNAEVLFRLKTLGQGPLRLPQLKIGSLMDSVVGAQMKNPLIYNCNMQLGMDGSFVVV